jgi:hypothetical protein
MSIEILVALTGALGFLPIVVDPQPPGSMAASSSSVTAETQSAQGIRFTGVVTFRLADADGDDLAEALVADIEVEVLTPGTYSLTGALSKSGRLISQRPGWNYESFSWASLEADRGTHTTSLAFSGEDIFRSGEDGPYELDVQVLGEESDASLTVSSPPYDHSRFGEVGASIAGASEEPLD